MILVLLLMACSGSPSYRNMKMWKQNNKHLKIPLHYIIIIILLVVVFNENFILIVGYAQKCKNLPLIFLPGLTDSQKLIFIVSISLFDLKPDNFLVNRNTFFFGYFTFYSEKKPCLLWYYVKMTRSSANLIHNTTINITRKGYLRK